MQSPVLAVTMGDPAGIGPEILIKAFVSPHRPAGTRLLAVGDAGVMRQAAEILRCNVKVHDVTEVAQARYEPGTLDVLDLANVDLAQLKLGTVSAMTGEAAYRAIERGIQEAMAGTVRAVVTNPIHKAALNAAGHKYAGHTEIFGDLTGTKHYAMMLAEGDFRVAHVSTHVALRKACDAATYDRVLRTIRLADDACRKLGIARPRISVCGLNPHAGDDGLFGDEEIHHIRPAVQKAQAEGLDVEGPLPADTLFPRAAAGGCDVVIAMYHDQGHVPLKLKGFQYDASTGRWTGVRGINITLGLPIIRVSVDHGTACDQAGKGTASEESLIMAIDYAAKMAQTKAPAR